MAQKEPHAAIQPLRAGSCAKSDLIYLFRSCSACLMESIPRSWHEGGEDAGEMYHGDVEGGRRRDGKGINFAPSEVTRSSTQLSATLPNLSPSSFSLIVMIYGLLPTAGGVI